MDIHIGFEYSAFKAQLHFFNEFALNLISAMGSGEEPAAQVFRVVGRT
jgi:hypothetical protein